MIHVVLVTTNVGRVDIHFRGTTGMTQLSTAPTFLRTLLRSGVPEPALSFPG